MFRMFWYEIKMDFLRSIRYRFGMISDLLVYFALLPGSMQSQQFPMSRDRCRVS